MSNRRHFLEADDSVRDQNLRFVRGPHDEFQQFFGGPGGSNVSAPPRDYKVVTPKPGSSQGNNMNAFKGCMQHFPQLGKQEAYELDKRSFQNASFNSDYSRIREIDFRQPNDNMSALSGMRQSRGNDIGNNYFNRNRSPSMRTAQLSRIGNLSQHLGERQRSRSRSPLNYRNADNRQQQSNFPFMENNYGSTRNNFQRDMNVNVNDQNQNQRCQETPMNSVQKILVNLLGKALSQSNFDNLQQNRLNNGNQGMINNPLDFQQNTKSFGIQGFQAPDSNRSDLVPETFNQNNWQNNSEQRQQFNSTSLYPLEPQWNQSKPDIGSNSYSGFGPGEIPSREYRSFRPSHQSLQSNQMRQEQFSSNLGIPSFAQARRNFENSIHGQLNLQSRKHKSNSSRRREKNRKQSFLESTRSRLPQTRSSPSEKYLRGPKREDLKKKHINKIQSSKKTAIKAQEKSNKAASKSQLLAMPTRKNWSSWWSENFWVEEKVANVNEKDPKIIKTFFVSYNDPNDAMKNATICHSKMSSILALAHRTQAYSDSYEFLKCKIMLHELLFVNKGRGLTSSFQRVCETLLKNITNVDMVMFYKHLIRKFKAALNITNISSNEKRSILPSTSDIVFNWLVGLAFKELKRISNPILNPPKKSDQLKELHEFSKQTNLKKTEKILLRNLSKKEAEDYVRSTLNYIDAYLKNKSSITFDISKRFVLSKIRLMEERLDDKLDDNLQKKKNDILEKLKVDPYAKQNYNFLIDYILEKRQTVLNLQEAYSKLLIPSEREQISQTQDWIRSNELKLLMKHLLDERLLENGAYLSAKEAAEEKKMNLSFDFKKLNQFEVCNEPVSIPKTEEDQYKELYRFCSDIPYLKSTQNSFNIGKATAEKVINKVMRSIESYLTRTNPSFEISKRFVSARIRLNNKTVDEHLSDATKKKKYALIEKLKTDALAKKMYDTFINHALLKHLRYLHLCNMDPNLMQTIEKGEIVTYNKVYKNPTVKFMLKYLLDERFSENGVPGITANGASEEKAQKKDEETTKCKQEQNDEDHYDEEAEDEGNRGDQYENNGDDQYENNEDDENLLGGDDEKIDQKYSHDDQNEVIEIEDDDVVPVNGQ